MTNEPQLVFGISGTLLLHVPRNSTGTAHPNEFIIKMKRKDLEKVKRRRAWDVVSLIFPPYFVPAYPTNHSFPTGNLCKRQPSKAIHSIMKTVHQLHLLWEGLNFKRGMHSLYKSLRSHWWGGCCKRTDPHFCSLDLVPGSLPAHSLLPPLIIKIFLSSAHITLPTWRPSLCMQLYKNQNSLLHGLRNKCFNTKFYHLLKAEPVSCIITDVRRRPQNWGRDKHKGW